MSAQIVQLPTERRIKLDLVNMADVPPEKVEYFWEPYIARGKLTLLEGDPEVGKSWLTLAIAAAASTGGSLLDYQVQRGKVLLLTAEDDLADTVRVRLDLLGADPSNVIVLQNKFTLGEDGLQVLDAAIEEVGPDIVIIDPMIAYTDVKLDTYKANHVRQMMNSLKQRAEDHGISMVLVRHYRKAGTGKAIHQGAGSIDYSAAVRSIIAVTQDEDDRDVRIMSHAKCSYARKGPSWSYRLDDGLHWEGEVDASANQLVEQDPDTRERVTQRKRARQVCLEFLGDGDWHASKALIDRAKEEGINERTLKRARGDLRVEVEQREDGWWCRLLRGSP